jgi:hypothetical protein
MPRPSGRAPCAEPGLGVAWELRREEGKGRLFSDLGEEEGRSDAKEEGRLTRLESWLGGGWSKLG